MSNRSEAEISEPVRECVLRCANSANVSKCIADYAGDLVAQGWSDADVAAVVKSVQQVLDTIGEHLQDGDYPASNERCTRRVTST